MALLNIDTSNIPVATALDPIPAGWYNCAIVESEMKPNSTNNGAYLELSLEVLDGQFKGRKVWDRLNLHNVNPVAQEIAYKTLSAICHAVNVIQVQDSEQLHNRPLQVKVSLRPAGPDANGTPREASNEVKGYKAIEQGAPAAAPAAFAPPPAAPAMPSAPQPPAAPAFAAPAAAPVAPTPPWTQPATAAPATPAAPAMPAPAAPTAPPWAAQAPAAPAAGAPAAPPWAR